jgi:predicted nucleotidyltransferase component of viral defense system
MSKIEDGLPASIRTKLLNHAKTLGLDYNRVLERYALERYLYRLSQSDYANRFVLKGALLMLVWLGETIRPTRDADLLGFGDLDKQSLTAIFKTVCTIPVEPDAMEFHPDTVSVDDIRLNDPYGGRRITLKSHLGNARIDVQVDVGIGDVITPEPTWLDYPSLLGLPSARLRAYRPETSIAEKLHAMVVLGMANSRMKDFFDIAALAEHESFDGRQLAMAIRSTFERRSTAIPVMPVALTPEFATDPVKQQQWNVFLETSGLKEKAVLGNRIEVIKQFVGPLLGALTEQDDFDGSWSNGGPWQSA